MKRVRRLRSLYFACGLFFAAAVGNALPRSSAGMVAAFTVASGVLFWFLFEPLESR